MKPELRRRKLVVLVLLLEQEADRQEEEERIGKDWQQSVVDRVCNLEVVVAKAEWRLVNAGKVGIRLQ